MTEHIPSTNEVRYGLSEGEPCNRDGGCPGTLRWQPASECTCFISAPCSGCTTSLIYCPECEFLGEACDD